MLDLSNQFLAVIPAFNEANTVADVVISIRNLYPGATVLVVDDGSTDATASEAAKAGALVARHIGNLGVGAAMRTGFQFAERSGFHTVVQVDADGQHDPEQIATLLGSTATSDIVVGSRFAEPSEYRISVSRRLAIRLLSQTVSRLCNSRITDATSGFRATGDRAIALFARYYPSEYLGDTVESLALAGRVGLRIVEVPVSMKPRQGGLPSQSFISGILHLARSLFVVLQSSLRNVPQDARKVMEPKP